MSTLGPTIDKGAAATIAELPLPAGSHLVTAKTSLLAWGANSVYCALQVGTTADEARTRIDQSGQLVMTLPVTISSPTSAYFICKPSDDWVRPFYTRIVATPIGGVVNG